MQKETEKRQKKKEREVSKRKYNLCRRSESFVFVFKGRWSGTIDERKSNDVEVRCTAFSSCIPILLNWTLTLRSDGWAEWSGFIFLNCTFFVVFFVRLNWRSRIMYSFVKSTVNGRFDCCLLNVANVESVSISKFIVSGFVRSAWSQKAFANFVLC